MTEYKFITYQTIADGRIASASRSIAPVTGMPKPRFVGRTRRCVRACGEDDGVRVVILSGNGPAFSAGHDLGTEDMRAEREPDRVNIALTPATVLPVVWWKAGIDRNTTTTTTTPRQVEESAEDHHRAGARKSCRQH